MKTFCIILFSTLVCLPISARPMPSNDRVNVLEEKCTTLQHQQVHYRRELYRLTEKQKEGERIIQTLKSENKNQREAIDSLRNICKQLTETQSADRKNTGSMIEETNNNVQANQETLQSRTLWVGITVFFVADCYNMRCIPVGKAHKVWHYFYRRSA